MRGTIDTRLALGGALEGGFVSREGRLRPLHALRSAISPFWPYLGPEFRSSFDVIGAETSKPAREQAFWCIEHVFDVYLWGLGRLRPVRLVLGAPLGGVWLGSVELEEQRRLVDVQRVEDVALAGGELGALLVGAGGPGERAEVDALQLVAEVAPGLVGLVLGDPDQQQRQPAEEHVRADLFFFAVVDGAQVQRGLHVAPGALDLEQLLVAQRDVLGCEGPVLRF